MKNTDYPIELTSNLLNYYSDLSMHHRTMMVGFLSAYIGINQILLFTPSNAIPKQITENETNSFAFVVGAGLIIVFIVAATMHHACHFLATAGMKAIHAAEMHYYHLPDDSSLLTEPFIQEIHTHGVSARKSLAVNNVSFIIISLLYIFLFINNVSIYISLAIKMLDKWIDHQMFLGAFFLMQLLIILFYGWTIFGHYRYLQKAKRALVFVLGTDSKKTINNSSLKYFSKNDWFDMRRK